MLKRSGRSLLTKILFAATTLLIGVVFIASSRSSAANATKGQFQFEPLQLSAPCTPGGNANQPFTLPAGYGQTIIASEPQFPDLPDMTTLNENGNQAERYLYRTHEVGSKGAVSVTDLWTGETRILAQRLDSLRPRTTQRRKRAGQSSGNQRTVSDML